MEIKIKRIVKSSLNLRKIKVKIEIYLWIAWKRYRKIKSIY